MKRWIGSVCVALLAALFVAAAWLSLSRQRIDKGRVYRIGYASDAPFHFRAPDGRPAGLAVEMVQAAAQRRGIRLEWIQTAGSAIDPIRKGDLDFWVLLTIRPERRKFVYITEPFLVTETCFLVRAEGPFVSLDQLKTARVSFRNFGIHRKVLSALLPGMKPVAVPSSLDAIAAVRDGRADAAYLDQFAAVSALLAGDAGKALKIVPAHAPRGEMGLASSYVFRDVADQIREEMMRMANDGTLTLIVERWGFFPSLTIEAVEELETERHRVRWLEFGAAGLLALLLVTFWLWIALRRRTGERAKLEAQLQQVQKLESVGRLAGGVAHDFNNLLTVINGYGDLLLAELKEAGPLRKHVAEIRKAGQRGADLTRQLLAFSRKQIIEPTPLDLNTLVADSENMLRRVMGEDIEVVTICDETLGAVVADAGQIDQVLLNLAVNARDAMPAGGRLVIETANADMDANYLAGHGDAPPGRYVLLTVSDEGMGMDRATLQRIFEPFFTTKEPGKGTGLGLSTVYGIVKQSGGFVTVYSEPGCGTTFRIYLPRTEGTTASTRRPEPPPSSQAGSETILLVEDQEEVRSLAAAVLRGCGYQVIESARGEDALVLSKVHPEPIHLLLTDVVMPGMMGGELAKRLQQLRNSIQVLYMSGYSGNAIAQQGLLAPGVDYIAKPFTANALSSKVREILDRCSHRGTILVVDDDAAVRELFQQLLAPEGYKVLIAANGAEALDLIRKHDLDLVITDLVMPETEGLETIRTVRDEQPGLKVIAISGAFEGKFLQAAAMLGACATLPKPVGRDQLLITIRRVLG